jgi:antitoxin Phd
MTMLEAYFDELLARMQTPEAREGAKKAFDATPEELGKAAVEPRKIRLDRVPRLRYHGSR